MIIFDVSGLPPDNGTNALLNYEVRFSEPVNADWLYYVIEKAINEHFNNFVEPERVEEK